MFLRSDRIAQRRTMYSPVGLRVAGGVLARRAQHTLGQGRPRARWLSGIPLQWVVMKPGDKNLISDSRSAKLTVIFFT